MLFFEAKNKKSLNENSSIWDEWQLQTDKRGDSQNIMQDLTEEEEKSDENHDTKALIQSHPATWIPALLEIHDIIEQRRLEFLEGSSCDAKESSLAENADCLIRKIQDVPDRKKILKLNIFLINHCLASWFSIRDLYYSGHVHSPCQCPCYFLDLFHEITNDNWIGIKTDDSLVRKSLYRAARRLSPKKLYLLLREKFAEINTVLPDRIMKTTSFFSFQPSEQKKILTNLRLAAIQTHNELESIIDSYRDYELIGADMSWETISKFYRDTHYEAKMLHKQFYKKFEYYLKSEISEYQKNIIEELQEIFIRTDAFWNEQYKWRFPLHSISSSFTSLFSPPPIGIRSIQLILSGEESCSEKISLIFEAMQKSCNRHYPLGQRTHQTELAYALFGNACDPRALRESDLIYTLRWHEQILQNARLLNASLLTGRNDLPEDQEAYRLMPL